MQKRWMNPCGCALLLAAMTGCACPSPQTTDDAAGPVSWTEEQRETCVLVEGVKRPGLYQPPQQEQGQFTLKHLVFWSGDLDDDGPWVIRLTRGDGSSEVFGARGDATDFPVLDLRAGDHVVISPIETYTDFQGGFVYIGGHVGQPGAYSLDRRDGLTLRQLLKLTAADADGSEYLSVEVIRPLRDEEPERYLYTLDEMPQRLMRPDETVNVMHRQPS